MDSGQLIQKVLLDITSTPKKCFSSVDYSPPRSCHIAFVCKCSEDETGILLKKIKEIDYIEKVTLEYPFLNICFNLNILVLDSINIKDRNQTASVEHTSTVPVYPLSVAVFRSSVIGEWIRRSLSYLGYSVKGRIWIQDSARQVKLVSSELQSGHRIARKTGIGKGDHTIGRIFTESILKMADSDLSQRKIKKQVEKLFPLGQSGVRRPRYSHWVNDVLLGWRSTFDLAGIHINNHDRDVDLLTNGWENIISSARNIKLDNSNIMLPDGAIREEGLTYIERSILYYNFLLKQTQIGVSVVPHRQIEKLIFARNIACHLQGRKESDLTIIPFGETRVNGKLDSIKKLRFSCADNLAQYADGNIGCLLERFLTTRASSNININFPLDSVNSHAGIQNMREVLAAPKAILLLDELPLLLKRSIVTGDFSLVTQWTARAQLIREIIDNDFPSIAKEIGSAIDLFSPFPSRLKFQ